MSHCARAFLLRARGGSYKKGFPQAHTFRVLSLAQASFHNSLGTQFCALLLEATGFLEQICSFGMEELLRIHFQTTFFQSLQLRGVTLGCHVSRLGRRAASPVLRWRNCGFVHKSHCLRHGGDLFSSQSLRWLHLRVRLRARLRAHTRYVYFCAYNSLTARSRTLRSIKSPLVSLRPRRDGGAPVQPGAQRRVA